MKNYINQLRKNMLPPFEEGLGRVRFGRGWGVGSLLAMLTLILFVASLYSGSVSIPLSAITDILMGRGSADHPSWQYIIIENRLPQAVTALLSGASLAVSGLLLQTAFRNPLAGPSVLGIDSGAHLGVALVILVAGGSLSKGSLTLGGFALVIAAALVGALCVMAILLMLSRLLQNNVMLLIAGMMVGYIASSMISLLNFKATAEGCWVSSFQSCSSNPSMPCSWAIITPAIWVSVSRALVRFCFSPQACSPLPPQPSAALSPLLDWLCPTSLDSS